MVKSIFSVYKKLVKHSFIAFFSIYKKCQLNIKKKKEQKKKKKTHTKKKQNKENVIKIFLKIKNKD